MLRHICDVEAVEEIPGGAQRIPNRRAREARGESSGTVPAQRYFCKASGCSSISAQASRRGDLGVSSSQRQFDPAEASAERLKSSAC